jgi:hypothetical protein
MASGGAARRAGWLPGVPLFSFYCTHYYTTATFEYSLTALCVLCACCAVQRGKQRPDLHRKKMNPLE